VKLIYLLSKRIYLNNSYKSKRSKAININQIDEKYFQHEYEKKIDASYKKKLSRILIFGNSLFLTRGREILTNYTKMGKKKFIYKLKKFKNKNLITNPEVEMIDKGSWAIDEKSNRFFHWFTDTLTRISLADTDNYPLLVNERLLDIHYVKDSLNLLGINYRSYDPEKYYTVNNLELISHTAESGNYNNLAINNIANSFKALSKSSSVPKKNLWISREFARHRKITNYKELNPVFEEYNFQVVYPEKNSLIENINLFKSAEIVAGLHGAGLVNMLFMEEKTNVLEIRREGDSHNNCFFTLSSELNLNYYYINSIPDQEDLYLANSYLNPKILAQTLENLINNSR
jgi:hypothetical protein